MFSLETPHSGLANRSDRYFRLSMDIRCTRKSDGVPVVGTLAAVDRCAIAVDAEDGQRHVFRIDEDTYYRVHRPRLTGMPLTLDEIPTLAKVGDRIYVAHNRGTAVFVRDRH